MKKQLFFLAVVLISTSLSAQITYDKETHSFVIDTVITKNGISKSELYERAKEWTFRTIWVSSNEMALNDAESNHIFSKGILKLDDIVKNNVLTGGVMHANRLVSFRMSQFFKEGKCRIIVENIIIQHDIISTNLNKTETYNLEKLFEFKKELQGKEKLKGVEKGRLENILVIINDAERAMSALVVQYAEALDKSIISEREDW